jgi:hypothetical protein
MIKAGQTREVDLDETTGTRAARIATLSFDGHSLEDAQEPEGGGEDDRAAAVREAIFALADSEFNADKSPNLEALNSKMAEGAAKVSSDERDAVWADINK